MSNLGEQAMAILDELHTERLAYESEYVPLADAANLLTAYEETGMAPEDITKLLAREEAAEAENTALRRMQPVRLDDTSAQALTLAAEVSELRQMPLAVARSEDNMKIKLDPWAIMPTRAHDTDAGLDLYAPFGEYIPAEGSAIFNTGVQDRKSVV